EDLSTCGNKTGMNDWDFLILDELWLPQLCRALEQGHDPTLTHAGGRRCHSSAARLDGLSIHGLWPNYVGGYPSCCRRDALPAQLPEALRSAAEKRWVDPTWPSGDSCSICSMWGHEHMKHGSCVSRGIEDYMNLTLELSARLRPQREELERLLEDAGPGQARTADLAAIYKPWAVQVICDPLDTDNQSADVGHFLEIRTCWNRSAEVSPAEVLEASQLVQIDCGKAFRGMTAPCPEFVLSAAPPSTPTSTPGQRARTAHFATWATLIASSGILCAGGLLCCWRYRRSRHGAAGGFPDVRARALSLQEVASTRASRALLASQQLSAAGADS
ncbi:unnamed protein product, partial [Polarella glacialis]